MIHPYAYYLGRAARWYPDRVAVIDGETELTYRALDARASALARGLLDLGVRPGNRVAVLQANNHQFMEALIGIARTGAAFVPMLGILTEADHAYMLEDAGAEVLIVPASSLAARAMALSARLPTLRHLIVVDGDDGVHDYETLLQAQAGEAPEVRGNEQDLAQILYTSGTTGKPKGVAHSYASTQAAMIGWVAMAERQPGDVGLLYMPMSHFAARLMDAGWVTGGTAVILPAPDPVQSFAAIEQHGVTHLLAIPTLLQMFLDHPEIDRHDLSSLRFICYAAAPASAALVRRAIERFGSILHTGWGGTEAYCLNTHMTPAQHLAAIDGHDQRLLSCGKENSFGGRVRILDRDGQDVAVGEVGELCVRAPWAMTHYWNQPALTDETIVDGWLHFGDLARHDDDGYTYLVDRKGDMIITGGMNVYPREVEEALYQHPAVLEAAVFGIPDEKWGEAVKAVVALREGESVDEADLLAFAKERLAPFMIPKSLDFLPELPKTPVGKISRRDAKARYWSGEERMIHGAGERT
ncbi:MAG: long-chain-fatty-acid--CoA ligase [Alphaproteobacteria bacterium]|jgi:acyl-CoA synthetase (AMP-forming)/AMP-acid ligase II|nr:long-chain-fatty-acid--CoA ligase [Alphaproteobacteria bacterium]MDP6814823.1 long-chain-fatty-acid--CoA ligase [Alphaproteobacteria bacterium]